LNPITTLTALFHFFLQFFSVDDAPLRSVLWSHDSRVVIFPPFESYPQISSKGFTDLRAYVAAGNNVVFMGSYIALQVCRAGLNFAIFQKLYMSPPDPLFEGASRYTL
jgi:hypothetical protein